MTPEVSVIISARNEFPNIAHTIHSIINDLETSGYADKFEIILVDNGSEDLTGMFFLYKRDNQEPSGWLMSRRGLVHNNLLRVVYDPVMGNVSARNTGVRFASGKYLFFADAHISIRPGAFTKMIKAIDESGGIVHSVVEWMGGYPPVGGYQYSLKLGEKFWGTWNRLKVCDEWFYIPMSGHCFFGVRRDQFIDFGGYSNYFRVYGGGETYLDLKWWMFGSNSVCVPDALCYHLSAGRGYSYYSDDLLHNMMLSAYLIGGEKWSERILITYLDKPGANRERVWELYNQAMAEGKSEREFIKSRSKYSLEDLIYQGKCDGSCGVKGGEHQKSIWDVKNDSLRGKHISGIMIFEDWLGRIKNPEALEIYRNSPYQKVGILAK